MHESFASGVRGPECIDDRLIGGDVRPSDQVYAVRDRSEDFVQNLADRAR